MLDVHVCLHISPDTEAASKSLRRTANSGVLITCVTTARPRSPTSAAEVNGAINGTGERCTGQMDGVVVKHHPTAGRINLRIPIMCHY